MTKSVEHQVIMYKNLIDKVWDEIDLDILDILLNDLWIAWKTGKSVLLCGNGGSAANANHFANDLIYGINPSGRGMNVHSLCANSAINLCLANDIGYENIFSNQLRTLGKKDDILIALSGSGNSPNIVGALKEARNIGLKSFAFLGYDGGKSSKLADHVIHFKINDMQVSEDLQIMIGHILMKQIKERIYHKC